MGVETRGPGGVGAGFDGAVEVVGVVVAAELGCETVVDCLRAAVSVGVEMEEPD